MLKIWPLEGTTLWLATGQTTYEWSDHLKIEIGETGNKTSPVLRFHCFQSEDVGDHHHLP